MIAWVLGGGGSRGPLQAGALKALLQAGLRPDLLIGSSAGAINAAYIAIDPTVAQAVALADLWQAAGRQKMLSRSPRRMLWRALRGHEGLVDTSGFHRYLETVLGAGRTFAEVAVPLHITVCHLVSFALYVYGQDRSARIVDAVAASTAIPGLFPAVRYNGELFVDGGVSSNVPVRVAAALGATEIWAVDLALEMNLKRRLSGPVALASFPARVWAYQATISELNEVAARPGITLHHLPLYGHQDVAVGDFSHVEAMVASGNAAASAYLAHPEPNHIRQFGPPEVDQLPPGPDGARPFLG